MILFNSIFHNDYSRHVVKTSNVRYFGSFDSGMYEAEVFFAYIHAARIHRATDSVKVLLFSKTL